MQGELLDKIITALHRLADVAEGFGPDDRAADDSMSRIAWDIWIDSLACAYGLEERAAGRLPVTGG